MPSGSTGRSLRAGFGPLLRLSALKLVTLNTLIAPPDSPTWSKAKERILKDVRQAVDAVRWPEGARNFTIHPQSGKKRGEGNGVKPIKNGFVKKLVSLGWKPEQKYPGSDEERSAYRPGAFDVWLDLEKYGLPPFVVEWETGNISSSHRAMNKMALGLVKKQLSGGLLVLPTRALYRYLTDRVGNYEELKPYFDLWSSLRSGEGLLGVIAVEHDATSEKVRRIGKGTDGRAVS